MNGPEHYAEAERLLDVTEAMKGTAQRLNLTESTLNAGLAHVTSVAQVHATLALAAATAGSALGQHGVPSSEWSAVSQ